MTTAVVQGEAIEGAAIEGQSRKPPRTRGLDIVNGQQAYLFLADFDVKAHVVRELPAGCARLIANAKTAIGDSLVCASAWIFSIQNRRVRENVSKGSASHQTNTWTFPAQTAVRVQTAHQEIENAVLKRRLKG